MYKRILLPLDGSPMAEQAFPHALAQAECFGAELILLGRTCLTSTLTPWMEREAVTSPSDSDMNWRDILCTLC
jgi:nucleotide-binding universal stress UspA family protein